MDKVDIVYKVGKVDKVDRVDKVDKVDKLDKGNRIFLMEIDERSFISKDEYIKNRKTGRWTGQ